MGNAVVHFEIGAPPGGQLAAFYAELFGWATAPIPGYTAIDTRGGTGINGGLADSIADSPWSTFFVEAEDLQAILDKANLLGGRTLAPITDGPALVTFAMLADPDGLPVGLVQAAQPGPDQPAALGPSSGHGAPVDWFEVLGTDAERTQRFYAEMFGWRIDDQGDASYRMVDTGADGGIRGGLGSGELGLWTTVYASVADVDVVLAKAVELGGSRVYGPVAVDDHMQTGALRDPAGNVFGIYHHGPRAA